MKIQDSFLLDEVRSGFLVPTAVKQAWAAELEVLMEIDRVCKKHNIQYFADWGTLLGAVRHGGFVPWDDDMDIVMKREDYNKFMTVARFDMQEGFDVRTYHNREDCWLFMGKVVGNKSFCFEKEHLRRFHNFLYIACVDIFVLDYVYRDPEKEEQRKTLCKYMLGVADAIGEGRFSQEDKERNLARIEEMCGRKINRIEDELEMKRYLYGEVEKIFEEVPESEADYLTQLYPWGLKGKWLYFTKECYAQSVELPFESITVPVPVRYDEILKRRYRNCMKPVKGGGAHNYPFFEGQKKNLQKLLNYKLSEFTFEQSKLYRSAEEEAGKATSYKTMTRECADEIKRIKEELAVLLKSDAVSQEAQEQIVQLLQDSQQLAMDLGNMLDQVLGEGCSIVGLLEQYCEAIYVLYEGLLANVSEQEMTDAYEQMDKLYEAISAELEQSVFRRRTVLFLPVMAKDWDGMHKLWQDAVADADCDVYVVPLPYYYRDYDGSAKKMCHEIAAFPGELGALDYNSLTPECLELLHPEVIVIQNPYDSWNKVFTVPTMFYAENIRKYTEQLVYVSPFAVAEYTESDAREYFNMKYYVTMPGVVYADRVLVQSENMRKVYIEKLVEFAGEETRNVWEQRVTAWERKVEDTNEKPEMQKKKVLYGISLGACMGACMADSDVWQERIEENLRLFQQYKEQIDLRIQIFPDSDASEEIRSGVSQLLEHYSGELIENGGKADANEYVAYCGDAMPMVMDFWELGKPAWIWDGSAANDLPEEKWRLL